MSSFIHIKRGFGTSRALVRPMLALALTLAVTGTGCPMVKFKKPFSAASDASSSAGASDALAIRQVTPSSGPGNGGQVVAVIGSGFRPGASVSLGGVSCGNVSWISPERLECVAPAHGAGTVAAVVRNPDGQSAAQASSYAYTFSASWLGGGLKPATGYLVGASLEGGSGDGAFSFAQSVVSDGNGYFYVGDSVRIQRFSLATGAFQGAIGRLSGSIGTCPTSGAAGGWCTGGYFVSGSGDGMFDSPMGLAVDSVHGHLYAADSNNHRIQRFDLATGAFLGAIGRVNGTSMGTCPSSGVPSGWCTGGTFASGSTDGAFFNPYGLAVDPSVAGNALYVADRTNNRIQKFTLSTGAFAGAIGGLNGASTGTCPTSGVASGWCTGGTFYGDYDSPDGQFFKPAAVAIDTAHDALYVADSYNARVQQIQLSTGAFLGAIGGITSTGAGGTCPSPWFGPSPVPGWCTKGHFSGSAGDGMFYNPHSLAVDPVGGYLYVSDESVSNAVISRFDLATGAFAGSVGKLTAGPGGGGLNCPSAAGAAPGWCVGGTFINGYGDGAYQGAYGLALDPGGALFVADPGNHGIQKLNASSGAFVGAIGATRDFAAGWRESTLSYQPGGSGTLDGMLQSAGTIDVDPSSGFLYVAETSNHRISRFSLSTGAFMGAVGWLGGPSTGTCGTSGLTTDWCTGGTFVASTDDGGFSWPMSLAIDPAHGFMYVGDGANRVQKLKLAHGEFVGAIGGLMASAGTCNDPSPGVAAAAGWCTGGIFTSGTEDGMISWTQALAVDPVNGYLYLADSDSYRVQRFDLATGAFMGAIGNLIGSTGSCVSPSPGNAAAGAWCTGGIFDTGAEDGMFEYPVGLAVDPSSNRLYVSDGARVHRIDAATGASLGAIGNLTATTGGAGACPATGAAPGWCMGGTFTSGEGDGHFNGAGALSLNPVTRKLYVADGGVQRVVRIDLDTGAFEGALGRVIASSGLGSTPCPASGVAEEWCTGGTFRPGAQDGAFNYPSGVAFDAISGLLFVYDSGNSRIQRIAAP